MDFKQFVESSAAELYDSSVEAFPNTTKRQNSIDPIRIVKLEWMPYRGMKTLFIKGQSQNPEGTHGYSEYKPMVLFKNVQYHDVKAKDLVEIVTNDRSFFIEKISTNDVLVRCQCKDFSYRFNYYDKVDKSLYGNVVKHENKGGPPANPLKMPGMCKHLMKLFNALDHAGIIAYF